MFNETFFPEFHSDLIWIRIVLLFKGERIQISLKAGHHRSASETPLNGVSLACHDVPTLNVGLVVLRIPGDPVQYCLEILYFCDFSGGGGVRTPCPPSGSEHWTGQCIHLLRYTENPFYHAHRL